MTRFSRSLVLAVAGLIGQLPLLANNIQVSNVTLVGTNEGAATTQVRFNITWENSWRTSSAPNNWDAAWVLVKYRDAATGLWQHARLGSDADHVATSGSTIATGLLTPGTAYNVATNWGVGAFIHRSADGNGTFTANGVELRWNYGQNSIAFMNIAEVRVFAVEMVYVPQGSFSVGDGACYGSFVEGGSADQPFLISSEGEISVGDVNGSLWAANGIPFEATAIASDFPKGFAGFYLMKYELTQQQYVDFINTLTRVQQNTRTSTDLSPSVTTVVNRYVMTNSGSSGVRNGVSCDLDIDGAAPIIFMCDLNGNGIGGESNDGQWVACNFLSWGDVAAYLDWSGLRPMTEMEFEKACRGPLEPVAGEYAWGNSAVNPSTGLANAGSADEASSTLGANAVCGNTGFDSGPIRVGAFASSVSTRAQSGSGYYGAMGLSDNLMERVVTVSYGVEYTGEHGDGTVDAQGNAIQMFWPVIGELGLGARGGAWPNPVIDMCVSDRSGIGSIVNHARNDMVGGRGCRTHP